MGMEESDYEPGGISYTPPSLKDMATSYHHARKVQRSLQGPSRIPGQTLGTPTALSEQAQLVEALGDQLAQYALVMANSELMRADEGLVVHLDLSEPRIELASSIGAQADDSDVLELLASVRGRVTVAFASQEWEPAREGILRVQVIQPVRAI